MSTSSQSRIAVVRRTVSGRLLPWLPVAASTATLLALAKPAHAEQFLVGAAEYTHSAETTTDSHYRVQPTPQTPANWQTPVNYADGSVHVRLEVKSKPSGTPTRFQVCFEMKMNYCCTDQSPPYTAPGVYEWDTPIDKMWRPGPVDFSQGIVQSALILKDTNNIKPAPQNVGETISALYMPTELDVAVTVVSAGSVYAPPDVAPGGAGGAAGAAGSVGAAGATTGGLGGVGGSSGDTNSGAGAGGTQAAPIAGAGGTNSVTPGGGGWLALLGLLALVRRRRLGQVAEEPRVNFRVSP